MARFVADPTFRPPDGRAPRRRRRGARVLPARDEVIRRARGADERRARARRARARRARARRARAARARAARESVARSVRSARAAPVRARARSARCQQVLAALEPGTAAVVVSHLFVHARTVVQLALRARGDATPIGVTDIPTAARLRAPLEYAADGPAGGAVVFSGRKPKALAASTNLTATGASTARPRVSGEGLDSESCRDEIGRNGTFEVRRSGPPPPTQVVGAAGAGAMSHAAAAAMAARARVLGSQKQVDLNVRRGEPVGRVLPDGGEASRHRTARREGAERREGARAAHQRHGDGGSAHVVRQHVPVHPHENRATPRVRQLHHPRDRTVRRERRRRRRVTSTRRTASRRGASASTTPSPTSRSSSSRSSACSRSSRRGATRRCTSSTRKKVTTTASTSSS